MRKQADSDLTILGSSGVVEAYLSMQLQPILEFVSVSGGNFLEWEKLIKMPTSQTGRRNGAKSKVYTK
jgi:hypothetical protein